MEKIKRERVEFETSELPKDFAEIIFKLNNKIAQIHEEGMNIFDKIKNEANLLPENERSNYRNLKIEEPEIQHQIGILKLLIYNISFVIDLIYDRFGLTDNMNSYEIESINIEIIYKTLNEIQLLTTKEKAKIVDLYSAWNDKQK